MRKKNHTYIISEMACSHEGNIKIAKSIIDSVVKSQADAIQFQVWKLDKMVVPYHHDYKKLIPIEISYDGWKKLAEYVKEKSAKLDIIACVYEKESVDFCESIDVSAYKIHTSDLSNPELVKYVAATGKRIDLSIGGSTLDEITKAISWIKKTSDSKIWLMYGLQNFPTPISSVNLSYMNKLQSLYQLPVGYQDHTEPNSPASFWLPAYSIGTGISIIEKHITHDRSKKGLDHESALNPDEFISFVDMIKTIDIAKGNDIPETLSEDEIQYRKYSKKSIVASRDIIAGEILKNEDLTWKRAPELGLAPDMLDSLLGKTVKNNIPKDKLINFEDLN